MSNRDRLRDEYESNQEGVVNELQELFDDANAKLEIGYSATLETDNYVVESRMKAILKVMDAEADAAQAAAGIEPGQSVVHIRPRNKGAAEAIMRGEELGEFDPMGEEEDPEHAVDPYLGDTTGNLMRPDYTVAKGGGGGSSGRKRGPKPKPLRTLMDIILTDEPTVDSPGRSSFVGAKVSPGVKDALKTRELGVTPGQVLEVFVSTALSCKLSPAQIRAAIDENVRYMQSLQVAPDEEVA